MPRPKILYVGLEPSLVDCTSMPDLNAEKVSAGIRADVERMSASGYDVSWFPVDGGETAGEKLGAELDRSAYDCVVVGAGIRAIPAHLLLFEKLLNVIHARAAKAKICFNTKPTDTLEAVRRWV